MIWEIFNDFFYTLVEGSEFALLTADLFSLFLSIMVIYMIVALPIQIFIRWVIRFISAVSNTPTYYSLKKRFNRAPKE